jgi:hypothetical protein
MPTDQVASTTITVFVAFSGGWLSFRKDRLAKKHDLRTQYLLDAYRHLEGASNRKMLDEDERAFESALADVQLLGSGEQVRLAREFALDFAHKGVTNPPTLDELLESLRRDLRKELDLGSVLDHVVHLRIYRDRSEGKTPQHPG